MPGAPGFWLAVPADFARRTGLAALEGTAEPTALGGSEALVEGAAELGAAALSLGVVLGELEGDSALAISCQRPRISVFGGGGGGG